MAEAKKMFLFPVTVLKYAGKGVAFLVSLVTKDDSSVYNPDRLVGEDLDRELEKVKKQSQEFKNQAVQETVENAKKDIKLVSFKYVAKNSQGDEVKGIFDAEDITAVRVFLTNEGYEIVSIAPREKWDIDINIGGNKIKTGDLSFLLTQLATYIKAGIPLIDAMRILSKQTSKPQQKRILDKVVYELVIGQTFSAALEKQGDAFPNILVNMIKTSEATGDLAGTLDEMADYFTKTERSRKQMLSALIYPAVILTMTIAALGFIIIFVVPQFIDMFSSNGAELPAITIFIINASDFLGKYWWMLILGIVAFFVTYRWIFKHNRSFRRTMQTIFMKMPVYGNVIIYNEVANLTRTFASLLNHGVFITDSMEILTNITSNEIYKEIINRTLIGLSKGAKISETFKGEWAFPLVAYEMLVTGESTGQLALMMEKVSEHYSNLHENAVGVIKSLIEPIVIVILAGGVGFILMAIILPMFDLYGQL